MSNLRECFSCNKEFELEGEAISVTSMCPECNADESIYETCAICKKELNPTKKHFLCFDCHIWMGASWENNFRDWCKTIKKIPYNDSLKENDSLTDEYSNYVEKEAIREYMERVEKA